MAAQQGAFWGAVPNFVGEGAGRCPPIFEVASFGELLAAAWLPLAEAASFTGNVTIPRSASARPKVYQSQSDSETNQKGQRCRRIPQPSRKREWYEYILTRPVHHVQCKMYDLYATVQLPRFNKKVVGALTEGHI